jgi:hypothetical protein
MHATCGDSCFLMPNEEKFPICSIHDGGCKPDCRGILSAKMRARQWGYNEVAAKADRLIEEYGCTIRGREQRDRRQRG